jgi:hypothetical protein
MMQVSLIWLMGSCPALIYSRAIVMLAWICWANYRVGVRISPRMQWGRFFSWMLSRRYWSYERMGAAKARVLPEPVWAAMRKSW